jgi:hypothetical protein
MFYPRTFKPILLGEGPLPWARKSLARDGAGNIGQWDWENWMAGAEIVVVNFWRIDYASRIM